jgi:hypothetical protein
MSSKRANRRGSHVASVVQVRVDVPRPAGPEVEGVAAPRFGDHPGTAYVERDGANLESRGDQDLRKVARDVLHRADDRVVSDVRPAVVHVEDGDVDRVHTGLRHVGRGRHADPIEDRPSGGGGALGGTEGRAVARLPLTVDRHRGMVAARLS